MLCNVFCTNSLNNKLPIQHNLYTRAYARTIIDTCISMYTFLPGDFDSTNTPAESIEPSHHLIFEGKNEGLTCDARALNAKLAAEVPIVVQLQIQAHHRSASTAHLPMICDILQHATEKFESSQKESLRLQKHTPFAVVHTYVVNAVQLEMLEHRHKRMQRLIDDRFQAMLLLPEEAATPRYYFHVVLMRRPEFANIVRLVHQRFAHTRITENFSGRVLLEHRHKLRCLGPKKLQLPKTTPVLLAVVGALGCFSTHVCPRRNQK